VPGTFPVFVSPFVSVFFPFQRNNPGARELFGLDIFQLSIHGRSVHIPLQLCTHTPVGVGVGHDLRKGDAGGSDKSARDEARQRHTALGRPGIPEVISNTVVRSPETLRIQAGMAGMGLRGDRALGNLYRGADRYCGMPLTGRYYCKSLDNRA